MPKYLIIGNGIAGVSAAEAIRTLDEQGSLAMVAAEEFPPYSRPLISLVLEGTLEPRRLPIRPESFYRDLDIQAHLGHKVSTLDLERQKLVTDQGLELDYQRLLIASGADPRPLSVPGADLANIFYMRTQAQVEAMLRALAGARRALVLGGGLVGFKAAYGLMRRGLSVTMLIRSPHPLTMQVDATAGAMIRKELESRGLEVRVGVEVESFQGEKGRVISARLSDGKRLECQMVVVGKGVNPALDFLPPGGIQVDQGILVDRHLQTSRPGVYAAGDVAQAWDPVRGRPWVNAIWPVAVEQGRLAGANLAGRPVAYRGSVGRNVLRIFGLDLLTGGMVTPPGDDDSYRVLSGRDRARGTYRRLVLRGDTLVGMVMVNRIEQGGVLLSLIQRGLALDCDPARLLEPDFNLATLAS